MNCKNKKLETAIYISSLMHGSVPESHYHSHSHMEIVYTVSGTGKALIKNHSTELDLKPGMVIIYWPNIEHNQRMDTPGNDLCVFCSIDNIKWLPLNRQYMKLNIEADSFLKKNILNIANTPTQRNSAAQHIADLRCTALLLELIERAKEQESNASQHNSEQYMLATWAYNYICANYNKITSIKEVAKHVGVNYDYLRHKFREVYNISMKQHLLKTKIDWALIFLEYSPMPLSQIVEECGFSNLRYFSACIRERTGCPPGQYRMYTSQKN